ncbi:MAG TPA: hypothetical protein VG897_14500, partial [Terriglobales bacterium]|nr:hypothetical protein [Terriglobales bacterium]
MRRTVIATTANEIATLRPAWEALTAPTIFQTYAWNHVAARAFADCERPHVIYSESDNGAALIPTAVAGDRLTLLSERLADYRDVLTNGEASVLDAAWSEAAIPGLKLSTGALRADSETWRWEGFDLGTFYGAPLVSRESISAERFASEHNRLPRWGRRLEREGVHFRCSSGTNSALVRRIYKEKGNQ